MTENKSKEPSAPHGSYNEALDWLKAEQLKKNLKNTKTDESTSDRIYGIRLPEGQKKKKNMKRNSPAAFSLRNRRTIYFVLGTAILLASILGIRYFNHSAGNPIESTGTETIVEQKMPTEYASVWDANKEINEDYTGQIIFDSGLIDLPFVQAKSVYKENGEMYVFYTEEGDLVTDPTGYTGNDVYIWTNWKTGRYDRTDEGGSVFMDYRNHLEDQNLLIYGHHFARDWDPSGSKQFTPLDALLEKKNYKANSKLKLILDREIRYYTVACVFMIDVSDPEQMQIARTNMDVTLKNEEDPGFFKTYIKVMDKLSYYDTKVKLKETDRILTLVTCIQHQPQYRQIIVCREDAVETYD